MLDNLKKKIIKEEVRPWPSPSLPKTDKHCVVEGCYEMKAHGQNYVCTQHMRSN